MTQTFGPKKKGQFNHFTKSLLSRGGPACWTSGAQHRCFSAGLAHCSFQFLEDSDTIPEDVL